ncbi:MAG: hypothetical protein U0163_07990 [Gemmatimonadaceae bacterium]
MQRHRLPSSACRISDSLGLAFQDNRSTALMIIPGVQKTALQAVLGVESLLYRMQPAARGQPLDGGHGASVSLNR